MFEARRRASELGLAERELVVTRDRLDAMGDTVTELFEVVSSARGDLDDLGTGMAPEVLQQALERLLDGLERSLGLAVDG
jgi:hypothetical protein